MIQKILIIFTTFGGMIACAPNATQLKKTIVDNPDIVFDVIEKHPDKFMEVVNKAAREAQNKARARAEEEEKKQMDEEFKSPKQAEISPTRAVLGSKTAPITIIEYSDFECPYCAKGFQTVKEVMKTYGDKVKLVFKHLPLDFHPKAEPAARYFEAIAKQDGEKAYKWHDEIFSNQEKLKSGGEDFMKSTAKSLGVDMEKLKNDVNSESVKTIIKGDMEEAKKFGFSGTPGYLINGVSLKGAYPIDAFKQVIDRHLTK